LFAAFYRRWLWEAMGGFCEQLGIPWTDADFALSLQTLGYRSVLEPECVLRSSSSLGRELASLRSGRCAERVFWRHAAGKGWLGSLAMHPSTVVGLVLQNWQRPSAYLHLLGRFMALFGLPKHLTHAARVRHAVELSLLESPPAPATRSYLHSEREASTTRCAPGYRDAA
jgi:hypothetical protein